MVRRRLPRAVRAYVREHPPHPEGGRGGLVKHAEAQHLPDRHVPAILNEISTGPSTAPTRRRGRSWRCPSSRIRTCCSRSKAWRRCRSPRASARKKAAARKPVRKAAQKAAKRGGRARFYCLRSEESSRRPRRSAAHKEPSHDQFDQQAPHFPTPLSKIRSCRGSRRDGSVSVRRRGAGASPSRSVRDRRRHRPERDGDRDLPRVDAEERAPALRQGLRRRHDLHARHAGGGDVARRRPGRHGDAVVLDLRDHGVRRMRCRAA